MALGHLDVRAHSRTRGHSVAAALAYRLGCDLIDSRTGTRHAYRRRTQRGDVVATGFCYGAHAPAWNRESAQEFSDALEQAERRINSVVCRDVEISLPHELTPEQREGLAAQWADFLATRYTTAVAYAVHRPDRRSDERNHHVHCLISTRALGRDGTPGKKLRQFHVRARKSENDRETKREDSGGSDEIRTLRAEWETMCNAALAAAGVEERIAMGRLANPAARRPVLSRGEVEVERAAWRSRHPKTPPPPMAVSTLVVDDGVCVTDRGRALAQHVVADSLVEHVTGRPRPRPLPALGALDLDPNRNLEAAQELIATSQIVQSLAPPQPPARPRRPPRTRRQRRRPQTVRSVDDTPTERPAAISPIPALVPAPSTSHVAAVAAPGLPAPSPIQPPALVPLPSTSDVAAVVAPALPAAPSPIQPPALVPLPSTSDVAAVVAPALPAAPSPIQPPALVPLPSTSDVAAVAAPAFPAPSPIQPPALLSLPSTSDVAAVVAPEFPTPVRVTERVTERLRRLRALREAEAAAPTPVAIPEDDLELDQVQPTAADEELARATVARIATADRLRLVGEQLLRRHAGERVPAPALPELGATASETAVALVRTQTQRWQTRAPDRLPSALAQWRSWWAGHGRRVVASVIGAAWRLVWREDRAEAEDEQARRDAAAWEAEQQRLLVQAINLTSTAAACESLIREHGGEATPDPRRAFTERALGPRASDAVVTKLVPHVLAHCVQDHSRRPNAIARFHAWWRRDGETILSDIRAEVWPVHKEEAKVRHRPELEAAPIAQKATRRPADHDPGRFER